MLIKSQLIWFLLLAERKTSFSRPRSGFCSRLCLSGWASLMVEQINAFIGRCRKHRTSPSSMICRFSPSLVSLFHSTVLQHSFSPPSRHSQIETRNQSRYGLESIFHFDLARAGPWVRVMKVSLKFLFNWFFSHFAARKEALSHSLRPSTKLEQVKATQDA